MVDNKTTLVPGVGRIPYPAYQGDEPYIFISYAHVDNKRVFAEIKRFNEAGYHVWYDEGITPGNEWTDEIAAALEKCSLFVVFLTKNSVQSSNVADEINYVIDEKIPAIAIYLEKCELQGGLKLRFQRKQAIMKYQMPEEEYVYKYQKAFDCFSLRQTAEEPHKPPVVTKTPLKRFNIKLAVIIAAAVLVVAGGVLAFTAISGSSNNSNGSNNSNSGGEQSVAAAYGEEDIADLLSAKPTSESSFVIENGTLTEYKGSEDTVVIPDSVYEIGIEAFKQKSIKRVYITSNVTTLSDSAFLSCHSLEEVYISDSVLKFGSCVFDDCSALKKVRLPQQPTEYGSFLFKNCKSLESVIIPETYSKIPDGCFAWSGIKNINIPSSVKEIAQEAFRGCNRLVSIEIPKTVRLLGVDVFRDCVVSTEIKLNEGLKEIDGGAFKNCSVKEVTIPKSVDTMYSFVFDDCNAKVKVYKDSYAEQYMIENNYEYKVID